jgi:hypothetical protein
VEEDQGLYLHLKAVSEWHLEANPAAGEWPTDVVVVAVMSGLQQDVPEDHCFVICYGFHFP